MVEMGWRVSRTVAFFCTGPAHQRDGNLSSEVGNLLGAPFVVVSVRLDATEFNGLSVADGHVISIDVPGAHRVVIVIRVDSDRLDDDDLRGGRVAIGSTLRRRRWRRRRGG